MIQYCSFGNTAVLPIAAMSTQLPHQQQQIISLSAIESTATMTLAELSSALTALSTVLTAVTILTAILTVTLIVTVKLTLIATLILTLTAVCSARTEKLT